MLDVCLQDVNLQEGTLCGSSTWHLPNGKSPVVTSWEGDIIDNVNHSFVTQKWGATQQSDLKQWSKFPHFVPLRLNVLQRRGRWDSSLSSSAACLKWSVYSREHAHCTAFSFSTSKAAQTLPCSVLLCVQFKYVWG